MNIQKKKLIYLVVLGSWMALGHDRIWYSDSLAFRRAKRRSMWTCRCGCLPRTCTSPHPDPYSNRWWSMCRQRRYSRVPIAPRECRPYTTTRSVSDCPWFCTRVWRPIWWVAFDWLAPGRWPVVDVPLVYWVWVRRGCWCCPHCWPHCKQQFCPHRCAGPLISTKCCALRASPWCQRDRVWCRGTWACDCLRWTRIALVLDSRWPGIRTTPLCRVRWFVSLAVRRVLAELWKLNWVRFGWLSVYFCKLLKANGAHRLELGIPGNLVLI